jgi:hypothetical protein
MYNELVMKCKNFSFVDGDGSIVLQPDAAN